MLISSADGTWRTCAIRSRPPPVSTRNARSAMCAEMRAPNRVAARDHRSTCALSGVHVDAEFRRITPAQHLHHLADQEDLTGRDPPPAVTAGSSGRAAWPPGPGRAVAPVVMPPLSDAPGAPQRPKIGRASCRERV